MNSSSRSNGRTIYLISCVFGVCSLFSLFLSHVSHPPRRREARLAILLPIPFVSSSTATVAAVSVSCSLSSFFSFFPPHCFLADVIAPLLLTWMQNQSIPHKLPLTAAQTHTHRQRWAKVHGDKWSGEKEKLGMDRPVSLIYTDLQAIFVLLFLALLLL